MVIYGAGNRFHQIVKEEDIKNITMVVDSHPERYRDGVEGYEIHPKEELSALSSEDCVCISSSIYYKQICQEIKRINPHVKVISYSQYRLHNYISQIRERVECYEPLDENAICKWIVDAYSTEVGWWRDSVPKLRDKGDERFLEREFCYKYNPEIKFSNNDVILDVGSGPLPKYGCLINGKRTNYIPVDPLAYKYHELLNELNISLPVYPKFALMETLTCFYPKESADFVIINNALDHCIDIMRAFIECFNTVKVGGYLLLEHLEAEALFCDYWGLHLWNIFVIDEDLYFCDEKKRKVNVSKLLKDYAEIETKKVPYECRYMIISKIHKRASIPEDILQGYDTKLFVGKMLKELFRSETNI